MPIHINDSEPIVEAACRAYEDRLIELMHLRRALKTDDPQKHDAEVVTYLMDRARKKLKARLEQFVPDTGRQVNHDIRIDSHWRAALDRHASRSADDDYDPRQRPRIHRATLMPPLVIIRGAPGSGKSTLARKVASHLGYEHYEADMYHTHDGVFRFAGWRAADAHRWCQAAVRGGMRHGVGVIVGNPLLDEYDVADYTGMSDDVILVSLQHEYGSTHAPIDVELRMRRAFQHHEDFQDGLPAHVRTMTEEELVAWAETGEAASPSGYARPLRIPRY